MRHRNVAAIRFWAFAFFALSVGAAAMLVTRYAAHEATLVWWTVMIFAFVAAMHAHRLVRA